MQRSGQDTAPCGHVLRNPGRRPGQPSGASRTVDTAAALPREGYVFGSVMAPPLRLAYGLGPLLMFLEERGIEADPLLEQAEIPRFALEEPSSAVRVEQELEFTRLALARLRLPQAGLLVGRRYNAPMFGILGLAAASAPSMLEMQRTLLAYPALTWGMFEITVWREGDEGVLRFEQSAETGDCTGFFMERDLACSATLLHDALSASGAARELLAPRLVRFRHEAPSDRKLYRELLGCEVRFGEPATELRFDASMWALRPQLANEMSFRFFDLQCRRLAESLSRPLEFRELVRSRLRAATPVPSLPELARALHLGNRTLQRRLAGEGSSFAEILREVRLERAMELLQRGGLLMDEIAWRLGFSDAVAFSRAFKSWTGMAPARFRETAHRQR